MSWSSCNANPSFAERYRAYFTRNAARHVEAKTELDPMPRVVLVPGLGLFGLGRTAADARIVFLSPAAILNVVDTAGDLGAADRDALARVTTFLSTGALWAADGGDGWTLRADPQAPVTQADTAADRHDDAAGGG